MFLSYAVGAGFSFAFLKIISEIGAFSPFPKVQDLLPKVDGICGCIKSEHTGFSSLNL